MSKSAHNQKQWNESWWFICILFFLTLFVWFITVPVYAYLAYKYKGNKHYKNVFIGLIVFSVFIAIPISFTPTEKQSSTQELGEIQASRTVDNLSLGALDAIESTVVNVEEFFKHDLVTLEIKGVLDQDLLEQYARKYQLESCKKNCVIKIFSDRSGYDKWEEKGQLESDFIDQNLKDIESGLVSVEDSPFRIKKFLLETDEEYLKYISDRFLGMLSMLDQDNVSIYDANPLEPDLKFLEKRRQELESQ